MKHNQASDSELLHSLLHQILVNLGRYYWWLWCRARRTHPPPPPQKKRTNSMALENIRTLENKAPLVPNPLTPSSFRAMVCASTNNYHQLLRSFLHVFPVQVNLQAAFDKHMKRQKEEQSICTVQAVVRGWLLRRKLRNFPLLFG